MKPRKRYCSVGLPRQNKKKLSVLMAKPAVPQIICKKLIHFRPHMAASFQQKEEYVVTKAKLMFFSLSRSMQPYFLECFCLPALEGKTRRYCKPNWDHFLPNLYCWYWTGPKPSWVLKAENSTLGAILPMNDSHQMCTKLVLQWLFLCWIFFSEQLTVGL